MKICFLSALGILGLLSACSKESTGDLTRAPAVPPGQETGNGGDVVICHGSRPSMMLDYYEASQRQRPFDLGGEGLSIDDKIRLVMQRLRTFDKELADRLEDRALKFRSDAEFLQGVNFQDIPDSGLTILPQGCELKQIAVMGGERVPGDSEKFFLVSQDLWNLLGKDQQTGMILHEVIYEYLAKEKNHANSRLARYFNGELANPDFAKLTPLEYNRSIAKYLGLKETTDAFGTLHCKPDTVERWSNQSLKFCKMVGDAVVKIKGEEFTIGGFVRFYENGNLHSTSFGSENKNKLLPTRTDINARVPNYFYSVVIEFYDDGFVKEIRDNWYLLGDLYRFVDANGQIKDREIVSTFPYGYYANFYAFSFYPSGWITHTYCMIAANVALIPVSSNACLFRLPGDIVVKMSGHSISGEEGKRAYLDTLRAPKPEAFSRIELHDRSGMPTKGTLYCPDKVDLPRTKPEDCSYELLTTKGTKQVFPATTEIELDPEGRVKI